MLYEISRLGVTKTWDSLTRNQTTLTPVSRVIKLKWTRILRLYILQTQQHTFQDSHWPDRLLYLESFECFPLNFLSKFASNSPILVVAHSNPFHFRLAKTFLRIFLTLWGWSNPLIINYLYTNGDNSEKTLLWLWWWTFLNCGMSEADWLPSLRQGLGFPLSGVDTGLL